MRMSNITDKIKLYANTYVKGEVRSKNYEARVKEKKRLNIKLDLADTMFNELTLSFTQSQKEHVKQLITEFQNFRKLYPGATYEEIILSIIFYVRSLKMKQLTMDPKLIQLFVAEDKQEEYPRKCETIMWKITLHYLQKQPILPTEPKDIDHNILYKG